MRLATANGHSGLPRATGSVRILMAKRRGTDTSPALSARPPPAAGEARVAELPAVSGTRRPCRPTLHYSIWPAGMKGLPRRGRLS